MRSTKIQTLLAIPTPPQRSEEWLRIRLSSANSSEYPKYENEYGERHKHLEHTTLSILDPSLPIQFAPTHSTSWGTNLEAIGGDIFRATTGLDFVELGSIAHPVHPRIRGSVDGVGEEADGKLFVLETKCHYTKFPGKTIMNVGYAKQVIQNMEIVDADHAYYNALRLLPSTTLDVTEEDMAREPSTGQPTQCYYVRYNRAEYVQSTFADDICGPLPLDERPISMVAVGLSSPNHNRWLGNIFDALDDTHSILSINGLYDMLLEKYIKWSTLSMTKEKGEGVRQWMETVMATVNREQYFACVYLKLDSHNIQYVGREHQYWEEHMLPIAEKWLEDMDKMTRMEAVDDFRHKGPIPSGVY